MSIRLRIEHGQDEGKTFRLAKPGVYTVGRLPNNSVRILDMRVSKLHCEIHISGDGAAIRDRSSNNGCIINGQPLGGGDSPLRPGDEIRLGLTITRILSDGQADEEVSPSAGHSAESTLAMPRDSKQSEELPSLPPDELVGRDLGGYVVQKKIGEGGMGGVYLAEQTSLKRHVALKVLNEQFAADQAFVDQFVNEARAAGALNHPNVVQVYDVGSSEGRYFFSMEVMPGGSIEDQVKETRAQGGTVRWKTALNWFIDAANALIFAKKKEILHRDVKPDNLMLAEDGSAKLCDLGLAKKSEHGDLMKKGIIGTPHFISPESIRRKSDIDHRTDLYSLGCSFYRVLTGKNPYPANTVKEILLGHLNKPVPRVDELQSDVPRDLCDIVETLMAKEPDERYESPEDLLQALDKVRLRHGLEAHGIRPHSRKPLIFAGLVALAAIGAGIYFATRKPPPPPVDPVAQAKLREAELTRLNSQLGQFVNTAIQDDIGFRERQSEADLDETYSDPRWGKLADEWEAAGKTWIAKQGEWQDSASKEKDAKRKEKYVTRAEELKEVIARATLNPIEIRKRVKYLKDNEKRIKTARENAAKALKEGLEGYAAEVQAHFDKGEYVELERALDTKKIQALVEKLAGAKDGDIALINRKKQVEPLVKKLFGAKPPYGAALLAKAKKAIAQQHKAKLDEAKKVAGTPATSDGLAKAIEGITPYHDSLPSAPVDKTPGPIETQLINQRSEVARAITGMKGEIEKLRNKSRNADRVAYYELIRRLRCPSPSRGLLAQLAFTSAASVARTAAEKMNTAPFRALAEDQAEAAASLKALFDTFPGTFGDWKDKKIRVVDSRGKLKAHTIKELTTTSLKYGRESINFVERGVPWLLERVLKDADGKLRFAPNGEQHFAIATLAELAGDFELAASSYAAAKAALPAEDRRTEIAARRMGKLEAEKAAHALWKECIDLLEMVRAFKRKHAPSKASGGMMSEEDRQAVFAKETEMRKALADIVSKSDALKNTPRLLSTHWGTAVRSEDKPHPKAVYVPK